jgi:CheY-like chemotaxis protein
VISLVDEQCQWFKARAGTTLTGTPREDAFCAHAVLGSSTLWVADAREDARFRDNPLVTGDPNIRFYAGAPVTSQGFPLGTLCVLDSRPQPYDPAFDAQLRSLAAVVSDLLELHRLRLERDAARLPADAMLVADAAGVVRQWSEAAETLFGRSRSDALGRELATLIRRDETPPAPAERAPPTELTVSGRPPRVLLAEDHPANRKIIELVLRPTGVKITVVENGADAVAAFRAEPFDLILMDVQMPVMDGLTAIRLIRAHEAVEPRSRTPILALTANAMAEHVAASSEAGADGHLTKPVTAAALLEGVGGALQPRAGTGRARPGAHGDRAFNHAC